MEMGKVLFTLSLSIFLSSASLAGDLSFPNFPNFFFGVSNAPSQVEDQLDDIWMQFARDGKIPAFFNHARPHDRIAFWSNPEKEIALAKELGTEVFRMGIDWQRLVPAKNAVDLAALERYREIIAMVKASGMQIMVTLFHHTEPFYTHKNGSWRHKDMIDDFRFFWKIVLTEFGGMIDYLVTFNEAQIYIMMTQLGGLWPNEGKPRPQGLFNFWPFKGRLERSLRHMAEAHREVFNFAKQQGYKFPVGVAHNVGYYVGHGMISKISAHLLWQKINYRFIDLMADALDYIGINYYGIEVVKGLGVAFDPKVEYSDSGRGIYPMGLYLSLTKLHKRYNIKKKYRKKATTDLPFIITENGVADENDWYRPLYLTEHLAAVKKAMNDGIKVLGYIQWTLTDNLEWADGYCPKFGMVAIDRETMERTPRGSFYFYQQIIKDRTVTQDMRDQQKDELFYRAGEPRPMCRAEDGATSLAEPRFIPVKSINWTFDRI